MSVAHVTSTQIQAGGLTPPPVSASRTHAPPLATFNTYSNNTFGTSALGPSRAEGSTSEYSLPDHLSFEWATNSSDIDVFGQSSNLIGSNPDNASPYTTMLAQFVDSNTYAYGEDEDYDL